MIWCLSASPQRFRRDTWNSFPGRVEAGDRVRDKVTRAVSILSVMVGLTVGVRSQESNTRKEVWPEVDVYVPLNEKVRLVFLFALTKSEETRDNLEAQFGANVDF